MPAELPYLASYKNVSALFDKIKTAKIPEAVTTRYIANTLGFKNSGDRALITLLKTLGFVDASGIPTKDYSSLKNDRTAKAALATGIRRAYGPLFDANEKAYELPAGELRGLIAQVAGSDDNMTSKIVGTFKALCSVADFSAAPGSTTDKDKDKEKTKSDGSEEADTTGSKKALRPDFHYNIQVHLPTNATEETYINIFNAIRKVFK